MTAQCSQVLAGVQGSIGQITLHRPQALNALSLPMVRALYAQLLAWRDDPSVLAVAIRGSDKQGPFGHFCAGGDIRFLHQAASTGDPQLEAFFTEEYALNHLIHTYPKPYIAFMDGVVMGGGMGISQRASCRIVTEKTQMAMPETVIGLIPDVGAGYFLSRCPGAVGEWLALTGESLGAADALAFELADAYLPSAQQAALWDALGHTPWSSGAEVQAWVQAQTQSQAPQLARFAPHVPAIDAAFGQSTLLAMVQALQTQDTPWAQATIATLRQRSPLMLWVVFAQIRRARGWGMADVLRMERGLMWHCFHGRSDHCEALEGIRALVIDKDRTPHWVPNAIEAVPDAWWRAFFVSPWSNGAHPLSHLADESHTE